jgi:hypothetical protein
LFAHIQAVKSGFLPAILRDTGQDVSFRAMQAKQKQNQGKKRIKQRKDQGEKYKGQSYTIGQMREFGQVPLCNAAFDRSENVPVIFRMS